MDKLDLKNLISEINEVIPYTYNKQKNSSFDRRALLHRILSIKFHTNIVLYKL